jgi:hypothetical protein
LDENSIADDSIKESESEYDDDDDPDYKPKKQNSDDKVEVLGSDDDIDDENMATAVVVDDNDEDYEFFTSREFNAAIETMGGNIEISGNGEKTKLIRGNVVLGGQEEPDTTGMSAEEATDVIRRYNKDQKAYTDKQKSDRQKQGNLLPSVRFSGTLSPSLRMESVVENCKLVVGNSFNDKTILCMRVMEEANQNGISVKTVRSNNYTLKVQGDRFLSWCDTARRRVGLSSMPW